MYDFIMVQIALTAGVVAVLLAFLLWRRGAGGPKEKTAPPAVGLRRGAGRIRAMAQMSSTEQAAEALEPFWASADFDESYFSLYFSIPHVRGDAQKERARRAVLAAPFRSARKTEMLRALNLPNALFQDLAEQSAAGRADMIGSLDGAALTCAELERLLRLLELHPSVRSAALPCFAASPLRGAFEYLEELALGDEDPALREKIAALLAGRGGEDTRRLLEAMMGDPFSAVREQAAQSMAAQGEAGAARLSSFAAQEPSQKQKLARRHLLLNGT